MNSVPAPVENRLQRFNMSQCSSFHVCNGLHRLFVLLSVVNVVIDGTYVSIKPDLLKVFSTELISSSLYRTTFCF